MRSIAGWIERHAALVPERAAITADGRVESYAALAQRISQLAHWLAVEQGLAAGSRVAWLGHNRADLLALLFACAQTQCLLVPLNWRLSSAELKAVLDDADAALVIVDVSCRERVDAFIDRRLACRGFELAGVASMPLPGAAPTLVASDVAPATPVLLVYTSGTTGQPKGAVLTQEAVLFNALNSVHMHGMTASDRILTVLPMFHVGGLNIQTLPALYCGAEVILEARFEPAATLARINDSQPSLTTLVPATIAALMAEPGWPQCALGSLRSITTGSTDVPVSMIAAVHERGVPVIQIYGATETGPVAIYQTEPEALSTVGSIGRAGLHTEIRLVDGDGGDVATDVVGEILVRGPHVASGYWDSAGGNIAPFADGWFATGDAARCDANGLYWFADRLKHVIISGGENIYPAELERILASSDLVREAAVVGRPDPRWGEVPVVVAVRRDENIDEAAVLGLFDDRIARYKRPHGVVFTDELPRTALGKVAVPVLREQVLNGAARRA